MLGSLADRRGRAGAVDGAPARAARAARLVPRDRAERRAVPRLGDLRADRDRLRGRPLSDDVFGFERSGVDDLLRRAAAVLALMGPIGFVRRFLRKFAIWAVALRWSTSPGGSSRRRSRRALVGEPGEQHGSFWLARRPRVAVTVSWAPLVADYTRFSRDRRSALFGSGSATCSRRSSSSGSARSSCCPRRRPEPAGADPDRDRGRRRRGRPRPARAHRGRDGRGLRERLLGRDLDAEPAAARSAARADRSPAAIATLGALAINMRSYQQFLLLLGAVFVPLLGVLPAHWLYSGAHYTERDFFGSPAFRLGPIVAWAAGLPALRVALPAGRPRLLERPDREAPGARVPDRRLATELRACLRPDRGCFRP